MTQLKRHLEARIPGMFLKVGACLLSALLAALLVPLQFMPRQALADGYTLGAKLVDGMPSPVPANTTFDVIVTVNNDTALSASTLTLTYPAGMDVVGIVTSERDVNGNQVMKAATSIDTQNRVMTFDLGSLGAGSTTIPVRFCNSGIADPITLSGLSNGTCGYDVSTAAGSLGAIAFSFAGTAAQSAPATAPVTETPAVETPTVETPVTETPVVETPTVETPVAETPVTETPVAETATTEAPATDASATQTAESQTAGSQATGSQASGSQASGSEGSGSQVSGSQPSEKQVTISYKIADGQSGDGGVDIDSEDVDESTGDAKGATAIPGQGFRFVNWTTVDATGATIVAGTDATLTSNQVDKIAKATGVYVTTTFIANFAAESDITITYAASKGGSTSPASESLSPSTGTAKGSTATAKTGFRFVDWTNDVDGTTTTDATLTGDQVNKVAMKTGTYVTATFTAHFEGETYAITFDPNRGDGDDMDDETLTYGTTTRLVANTFTRTGYTFSGWNTKADGTGTDYADKADVSALDLSTLDPKTSTVTLYAQWKASSHGGDSGSGNGNGGTASDGTDTTTSGGLETESTSDGGYTTADYTYSGGTTTKAATATPYVIISKYTYGDDAEVKAGDTFILHLEVTNTSKSLNVENMIMSLDCGAALALTNTANSYYITSLPAGQTTVVEFALKALASGKPEEATVGVEFKYEYVSDSTRTQGTTSEKITIPVEQPDRFSIGDATGTTDATPGTEATISIPYVNKGKSSVYNVEATLQTDMDTTSTYKYLGNFDAGASGTIDFFVTPEEAGAQKATVKITYEDSDNNEKSVDVPVTLDVQDATDSYGSAYGSSDLYGSMYGSESGLTDGTDASTPKIPWLWIGIGGGALIAIIIVSACIHHHRKRAEEKFLAGDDDDDTTGKADVK